MEKFSLDVAMNEVYTKFKLHFYRNIFKKFETREATLTVIEICCVETIYALNGPTINELAEFINISQPNAAYKIANLVKKGYIRKVQSQEDRREYTLHVTDKFKKYYRINYNYIKKVNDRLKELITEDELNTFKKVLLVLSRDAMTEVNAELKTEIKSDI